MVDIDSSMNLKQASILSNQTLIPISFSITQSRQNSTEH